MKPRFAVPAFCAVLLVAVCSFGNEPRWYRQPGTPVRFESSGFELRATLPHGWSFTTDEGFVPPARLASSCRIRRELYTDRGWDRFLLSTLQATDGTRTGADARMLLKISGHPAVSNRYRRAPFTIRDYYINLSDLQPDSVAVWTFEGSPTTEGSECELQFIALVHSSTISRPR